MPSEVIDNFDPVEWKEFMPGVYHLRSDPTQIAFLCVNHPSISKEESKEESEKEKLTYVRKKEDKN